MATITCNPHVELNDSIDEAITDAASVIVDSFFEQNGIPNPTEAEVDDGSDDTYYELKDAVRERLLLAINQVEFPDEYEYEEEDGDPAWLADELGLDEDSTCDEIFNAVFDFYRDRHDGQVTDLIVAETAEGATEEICEHLEVEYHRQEWT